MAPDRVDPRGGTAAAGGASCPERPASQGFTQAERIRRRKEYLVIYERGSRLSGSLMTVFVQPNTLGVARLGIAATRKIGSAVQRNRAKRRVRELFRQHKVVGGIDVVVIPRRELINAPAARIEADFRSIVKRRGVVLQ
jgi:ribonuclease P protein component